MIYQKFLCIKVEFVITAQASASERSYTKKCRRWSLSPPRSPGKSLEWWWLSLTVAVIDPVCNNNEQQLKFFGTWVLLPNFPSWLPLYTPLILEYRNILSHGVCECSSWPHMYMFHEVFWLLQLPRHLGNTHTY